MLLTIDAGNSNLSLGAYAGDRGQEAGGGAGGRLLFSARLKTDRRATKDELAIQLRQVFALHGLRAEDCGDAAIGSVVAELTSTLAQALQMLTGREPLVLAPGIKTGLNIKINNPAQLGADLIATAVAAKTLYPLPCLIIDLGTATKISAVDAQGNFLGCSIAAGVALSLEALAARTSLLPHVGLELPGRTIGADSVESIQSGAVFGTACMIDGMLARMEAELGAPAASVAATGGLAKDIVRHCAREVIFNGELALTGLREIYRKNR
ncbi:MAG: type III pantothenate kinase [Oscillospiraceae bacterium]|jgi:type III pantothenate kinase|nr:type III pantothenate kinase [Oscillospiraceae bacterium]